MNIHTLSLSALKERLPKDPYYEAIYGNHPRLIQQKKTLTKSVLRTYLSAFGEPEGPLAVCHVPGRLEFIGKHTDYAGGPVLNMAASQGFIAISAKTNSRCVTLKENASEWSPWVLDLSSFQEKGDEPGDTQWHTYPNRTIGRVRRNFGEQAVTGACVAFGSDLPPASGMSSSSALMIMTFLALLPHVPLHRDRRFQGLELESDPLALAQYLACCENGQSCSLQGELLDGSAGVGTFGGSQDQTAIFHAKPGKLSIHTFCPTRWKEDVDLPQDLAILVAFSGFRAEKTQKAKEAFNRLAERAKAIPQAYNELAGTQYQWAADLLDLEDVEERLAGPLPSQYQNMDLLQRYKAFHAESNLLIPQATEALRNGDYDTVGRAVDESHANSKGYLNNISEEIDILVQIARASGALGASGFGAGFGGSAYALVPSSEVPSFLPAWQERYLARVSPPYDARFFRCFPVSHACSLF